MAAASTRVCVIGASGMIGQELVDLLVNDPLQRFHVTTMGRRQVVFPFQQPNDGPKVHRRAVVKAPQVCSFRVEPGRGSLVCCIHFLSLRSWRSRWNTNACSRWW
jgi:nucleoside-diphosphate-sugar epimerase